MSEYASTSRSSRRIVLRGIFAALIILSTLSSVSTSAATTSAGVHVQAVSPIQKFSLTEWNVPTASSKPYGIGVDTNGKVWLTENVTNKLARFDPTNNNFTEWNITTPTSQPRNVFVKLFTTPNASHTLIFFTEFGSSKIARFDPASNNLTEWALTAGSNPAGIYVDDNYDVWFAESGRDVIGRLTPSTGHLTEWTLPGASVTPGSPNLKPWSVYVQTVQRPAYTNRFVWFTEMLGNKIGRLEVTSNRLTLWDMSTLGIGAYLPGDLTIGIFQTLPVAIITNGNNKVSLLGNDTGGGSLYQETTLPSLNAAAMGLTYDASRNAAWFAENNVGNIANLNTTNVLAGALFSPTYCTILPAVTSPTCATPATTNSANITSTRNTLTAISHLLSPAATNTVTIHQGPIQGITEYSLPIPTSRPTFVATDSSGNVWFTESNVTANRIGRFSTPYVWQIAASPSLRTINPGQSATFSVNITLTSGTPQPLQLSLLNVPSGVTGIFSPQSHNPPFISTLTFSTTNSTPTGTFPMTIQAVSGGLTQSVAVTLKIQTLPPPVFDFSVSVSAPTSATVGQGGSASFTVVVGLVSGSPQTVNLTATGFPSGVSYSFTNPAGSPAFSSTLNIFTSSNTPGGTYPITITGTTSIGLTHTATPTPVLTITELPRDFNISSSTTQVVLVQSSRTDLTVTVTSLGYFNGNVTLAGSFAPSGLSAEITPSLLVPPPNGGSAQATVEITAPKNTVGNYQLMITGTSTTPARTHQLAISVQVSPCLIATATYGSELAPQVEFLRNFRDRQIMNTFAGSNFMTAFNAWYYSFSPAVARYETQNAAAREIARMILNPLLIILGASESTFVAFGPASEIGALAAGLLAGSLIGLTYLAIPILCVTLPLRRRVSRAARTRILKLGAGSMILLLAGFAASELLAIPLLMMVVGAGLILVALLAGAVLPALLATELRRAT